MMLSMTRHIEFSYQLDYLTSTWNGLSLVRLQSHPSLFFFPPPPAALFDVPIVPTFHVAALIYHSSSAQGQASRYL